MNNLFLLKSIPCIGLCLALLSCSSTEKNRLPHPEIKDGTAKVSCKITNFHPVRGIGNLMLIVPQPISAEASSYWVTTAMNEDSVFSFEVPVQCQYMKGYIRPEKDYFNEGFNVCLISGKETKMDIIYGKQGGFKIVSQTDSLGLTSSDLMNLNPVRDKLIHSRTSVSGYARTPNEFVQQAKISLDNCLKMIAENDTLSEIAKNHLVNSVKLVILDWRLLLYREWATIYYLNAGNKDLENFNFQEPDKKYYAFLKDFNLNNPQYLYDSHYSNVLEKILSNDILNIPPIGDTPVDQWMKAVKNILSKWVGFDKGLFYDLLAANSYAQQFDYEQRSLSDIQKENIKNYFKDKKREIAKILLNKDKEISKLESEKEPLVVNETPAAPKEKVMDAIVSQYKGKVVVVDFWATWCAPCLGAMKESIAIKGELKDKDVVFVYLANPSSPQKLWEKRIKGIGGEHYYLNNEEWESISYSNKYGFDEIPTYLIFDKKGELKKKTTAYPGNDAMRKMIEGLLL
jgi:thiol-disulfide isomerase/thioredoxin